MTILILFSLKPTSSWDLILFDYVLVFIRGLNLALRLSGNFRIRRVWSVMNDLGWESNEREDCAGGQREAELERWPRGIRVFFEMHKNGNNANIDFRVFTTWKQKCPAIKCYPSGNRTQALKSQVQHAPPTLNWALATWEIFKLSVHGPLGFWT